MNHCTILIMFSGEIELDEGSIWPDKDAPENWTAADVKAVMESCGSKWRVIDDWNLVDNLRVEVAGGGARSEVW
jgi:hypothetical protein